ncbi:MAG TPA: NAD(P)/FAD-dependent oxidoreductase [Kofleriaceae bacterium]|nr:NAD(P)/FAD-dependent oxidoreductase [Kofleriaceae bacterium]
MAEPALYDVLIVGGGPAGSTCARILAKAGAKVAIVDRATFPRVKLCGGWLSPQFWDATELSPAEYTPNLWEWKTCHVHFRGKGHALPGHGWFIRRFELDDFLLRRAEAAGAELHLGVAVKQIEREQGGDGAWTAGGLRGRILVGAGGTHCPVARMLAPPRPRRAVGAQELEVQLDEAAVARTRIGGNGEPELFLLDDIGGYGWNVAKSDWINVGVGTLDATAARDAWRLTHGHYRALGHLPAEAEAPLAHMKGHSYFLFEPAHLDGAYRDDVLLVGDALGLAHPITAEGIVPSTISARHAGEAIVAGQPASYPARLRTDPTLDDYRRVHAALDKFRALRDRVPARVATPAAHGQPGPLRSLGPLGPLGSIGNAAIARGFAWLFSGARLPAPRLLDLVLGAAR